MLDPFVLWTLLGAPGHSARNKKLLGAPGRTTRGSWPLLGANVARNQVDPSVRSQTVSPLPGGLWDFGTAHAVPWRFSGLSGDECILPDWDQMGLVSPKWKGQRVKHDEAFNIRSIKRSGQHATTGAPACHERSRSRRSRVGDVVVFVCPCS